MFNDDFLLIINTPTRSIGFSFKMECIMIIFIFPEIACGPKYDGYTPEDSLIRLDSIVLPF
jgi:hypothetical protein